ncbi:unnamed protein product [Diamesa serratosioi]
MLYAYLQIIEQFISEIYSQSNEDFKNIPVVQYELPFENEEFLREGLALIDLNFSQLDLCQHRAISLLTKSCNQLTSEEIGKLAILLLNCQFEGEGRSTYPCTTEMTLKQCTILMDNNAYQIYSYMTNRAISICSSKKQEHFRAITELTVSKLIQTTQNQLQAVQETFKNQRRINDMGLENAKALTIEKTIIEETDKHLVDISKTTNQISTILKKQKKDMDKSHLAVLNDVEKIAVDLKKSHEELIKQYNLSLEFLDNFKGVLQTLSHIANHIRSYTKKCFLLLEEVGIDTSEENIAFICMNLLYFVSGMVFLLFINAANTSKYIFMGLIVFNAVTQIFNIEIPLMPLNIFIKKQMTPQKIQKPLQANVQTKIILKDLSSLMNSKDDNEMSQIYFNTMNARPETTDNLPKTTDNRPDTPDNRPVTPYIERTSTPFERPLTPAMRRVMSESLPTPRSGTPFTSGMNDRVQCQSLTAKGAQCRNAAVLGFTKCRVHNY